MVVNDFEDDYKSDECDEHTAVELFYKAAFDEQSVTVSCDEYIKSRKSFSASELSETAAIRVESVSADAAAEIVLCLDKSEPIAEPVAEIAIEEERPETGRDSKHLIAKKSSDRDASDTEGIATKLEPRNVNVRKQKGKGPRKSSGKQSSSASSLSKYKRGDDSGDSDDINANIKPKRKKGVWY